MMATLTEPQRKQLSILSPYFQWSFSPPFPMLLRFWSQLSHKPVNEPRCSTNDRKETSILFIKIKWQKQIRYFMVPSCRPIFHSSAVLYRLCLLVFIKVRFFDVPSTQNFYWKKTILNMYLQDNSVHCSHFLDKSVFLCCFYSTILFVFHQCFL